MRTRNILGVEQIKFPVPNKPKIKSKKRQEKTGSKETGKGEQVVGTS